MNRLAAAILIPFSNVAAEGGPPVHEFRIGADIAYVDASGYPSWTSGSVGKLRYDDDSDGLVASRAYVDYHGRLADTVDANLVAQVYVDDFGSGIDISEAFLRWRPMVDSRYRFRLKLGAFFPRLSFENTEAGWDSPYTINSSTINTWIAEELRTVGAEGSVSRRLSGFGGAHTLSLQVAAFVANDPAGSLLAWRGWSAHDRQSRVYDELPLPALPQLQPGMMFDRQDPFDAPFREVDDRAGYYADVEWRIGNQALLRAMHYDNRAEPTALRNGQYAWHTEFDALGAQVSLPADAGLVLQWIRGTTRMGPASNGVHVVDADFSSYFLLLSKTIDRHRLSARYEDFDVTDNDGTALDDNAEHGDVLTMAYRYEATANVALAVEWLQISTFRPAWAYAGLVPDKTERQFEFVVRLRFGNRG